MIINIVRKNFDEVLDYVNARLVKNTMSTGVLEKYLSHTTVHGHLRLDVSPQGGLIIAGGEDGPHPAKDYLAHATPGEVLGLAVTREAARLFGGEVPAAAFAIALQFCSDKQKKHDEYAARRLEKDRRNARKWKLDRENGSPHRLDFFWGIFKACGYSTERDISKVCGCQQQNIHYYKMADDISLSNLNKMLANVGARIELKLIGHPRPPRPVVLEEAKVVLHYDIQPLRKPKESPKIYSMLHRLVDERGRLASVARVILDSRLNFRQFCARYGLNLQNYQHALKIDDLHVKAIYEFAKATGTEVQWDLYPLD